MEKAQNQTAKRKKRGKRTIQSGLFFLVLLGIYVVFLLFLERCLVSVLRVRTGLIDKLDLFGERRSVYGLRELFFSVKLFRFL